MKTVITRSGGRSLFKGVAFSLAAYSTSMGLQGCESWSPTHKPSYALGDRHLANSKFPKLQSLRTDQRYKLVSFMSSSIEEEPRERRQQRNHEGNKDPFQDLLDDAPLPKTTDENNTDKKNIYPSLLYAENIEEEFNRFGMNFLQVNSPHSNCPQCESTTQTYCCMMFSYC